MIIIPRTISIDSSTNMWIERQMVLSLNQWLQLKFDKKKYYKALPTVASFCTDIAIEMLGAQSHCESWSNWFGSFYRVQSMDDRFVTSVTHDLLLFVPLST